uniref:Uncharacterized protein n=1 Tax=Oryza sativa subsp. japonica TaxID=39947 RepID=Q5Z585_ORYSJ|nr:hypothetical protein [Oryza sativa Japonica Group]BAD69396.1 hypothetical protein [Oryza sativa Japonica Group]
MVYYGKFSNGVQVAVKTLHRTLDRRTEEQLYYHIKAPPPRHLFTSTSRTARLTASCSSMAAAVAWCARPVRYLHEEFQHWIMHYNIKLRKVLLIADVLRAQVSGLYWAAPWARLVMFQPRPKQAALPAYMSSNRKHGGID